MTDEDLDAPALSLQTLARQYGIYGGSSGRTDENPEHALPALQAGIEDIAWDEGIRHKPEVRPHEFGVTIDVGQEYEHLYPITEEDVTDVLELILEDGW